MKKYIYLLIYICFHVSCNSSIIELPKELKNKTFISIFNKGNKFYYPCGEETYFTKIITQDNDLSIDLMEKEYLFIEKIDVMEKGYKIYFIERNFYYKVTVLNGEILKWEYVHNNVVNEDFTYYVIDADNIQELPKPTCIDCFGKEDCKTLTSREKKKINGAWKLDCTKDFQGLTGLNPISEFYVDFIFLDNERARFKAKITKDLNQEKLYNLQYDMLTGITRGNTNLNWYNFSKDSTIANIRLKNNNELEFIWKGFYNTKTKRRESKSFVFTKDYTHPLILKKCNE